MLFVSFTKSKLKELTSEKKTEIITNKFIITIITDDLLSFFQKDTKGLTIYEAPFKLTKNVPALHFFKIRFDNNEDTISLSQSTISGRPLYYHINKQGEFFCSTHISLLKQSGIKLKENKKVIPEFFIYRYIMPPNTLYQDIYRILNGDFLKLKFNNEKWTIISATKLQLFIDKQKTKPTDKEAIQKTKTLLDDAIKKINPSKNKISFLLSGGLDSSILCRLLQINYDLKKTYSGGYPFENNKLNIEKEYALTASNAFETKHEYYEPTAEEYLKGLIESIYYAEEPIHHLQSVVMYLMFKNKIKQNENLIVSGFGADGIFGCGLQNKINRSNNLKWKLVAHQPFISLITAASKITSKGVHFVKFIKTKKERNVPLNNPNHIVWSNGKYGSEDWVMKTYGVKKEDIITQRYNYLKSFNRPSELDNISIINFSGSTSVSESILSKLAESNNKIIYYPFNDESLITYALSLDWKMKLKQPKYLLRKVAQNLNVPEFIITRKKSGFGLSIDSWAKKGSAFEPLVPLISKVFKESEIRKMQSTDSEKAMIYWNMINYGIWKRLFINNEPLDKLLNELYVEINFQKTKKK